MQRESAPQVIQVARPEDRMSRASRQRVRFAQHGSQTSRKIPWRIIIECYDNPGEAGRYAASSRRDSNH
ncbi:MAG: hypothetical protein KME55_36735 [Nostoc indistinguendum CM1-VF10]|nr:hypothetical protein [Nostoc indistinguendum CM1-VF10]